MGDKETKTKQFNVLIKPSIHQQLSDLAWQNRKSLNEYIGIIFKEHIKDKENANDKII